MAKKIKIAKRHLELPTPRAFLAYHEIQQESDRGAAVAGTAYLDLLLRAALEAQMRTDGDVLEALFANNGPLQDFSARIKLAYVLKIIGTGAYADLNHLRDIRNAFAHSAEHVTFDWNDVASKCRLLWYPLTPAIQYGKEPKPSEPREIFLLAIRMLSDGLLAVLDGRKDSFILLGPPRVAAPPASPKTPKPRSSRGRPARK